MEHEESAERRFASHPEILPPGMEPGRQTEPRGWYPPPQPVQRPRRHWAHAPATYTLVGVNCAVYLGTLLLSGTLTGPTFEDPISYGLLCNGSYVVALGQWWRLVTSIFVHFGWIHIATNMWCLWNLGLLGEPLLGAFGTVAVYLLTGVAGNLLSVAVHPGVANGPPAIVGVGASGAVFGLAGVLIVLLKSPLLPVPRRELWQLRRSVIYFAVLNFVIGASSLFFQSFIRIDNMAHLGGFLCGLALGVPLVPRIGAAREQFVFRRWVAYGGGGILILLFASGVASFWR